MATPSGEAVISDLLAHSAWLQRLARRLVSDPASADDAVQDTWVAALESTRPRAGSIRGWLARVMHNVVAQSARSESARRAREAAVARAEALPGAREALERAQALRGLVDALVELDEPYRSTLLLRYHDGLSAPEIARMQGIASSTVRNRIRRGVAALREKLERRHGSAWIVLIAPMLDAPLRTAHVAPAAAGLVSTSLLTLAGALAMLKTLSYTLASVVVVALVWWGYSAQPAAPQPASATAPADASPELLSIASQSSAEPVDARVESPSPSAPVASPSKLSGVTTLIVSAIWESDRGPAQGVNVKLMPWGARDPFLAQRVATTGADGRTTFENLAPGNMGIYGDRGGGDSVVVAAGETREFEFVIPRGITVRGRVVDTEQHAVGGARIWLSDYGNDTEGSEVATADADGRFVLRDVEEGHGLAARASGHAPSEGYRINGKPGNEVEITISMPGAGGAVRGLVRDPRGEPVARARVLVGREGSNSRVDDRGRVLFGAPCVFTWTDANGKFEVDGLPLARADVAVRAPGFAMWSGGALIEAGRAAELAIDLGPAAAIEGTVRDSSGAPAAGVFVGIGRYGDFASSQTHTASDGAFRFDSLSAGEHEVRAGDEKRGNAATRIVVETGGTARWDALLSNGGSVAGRVLDEEGKPLAGMLVGAIEHGRTGLHLRSATSGADGSFELDNWPAAADAIEVREKGLWTGEPVLVLRDVQVGRRDYELRVTESQRATAFITVRLLGPDGRPAPDPTAMACPESADRAASTNGDAQSGRVRIGPLSAGRYRIEVSSVGLGELHLGERELHAKQELDLGDVRFERPGRVHVRLNVAAGSDIPDGVTIQVLDAANDSVAQIEFVGLEGRSPPIAPGRYVVALRDFRMRNVEVPVEVAPDAEVEVAIDAERATYRAVSITWPEGAAAPKELEYSVTAANGAAMSSGTVRPEVDRALAFVPNLQVGEYDLAVRAPDGRSARAHFKVADLEITSEWIELVLR
jgi:RNA polymerase sigma-70 factor (ECF subfamily)